MTRPEQIVCFAGDNYRFSNPHSRYHLMHALHRKGHQVLWVNSIGMNMPKLGRRGFGKRVWMKVRSWANFLYSPVPNLHVLTPIALPLFGNRFVESVNNAWIAFQVRLASRLVGISNPVVFASIPSFAPVVANMRHCGLIYYYSDKYDSYRDITARDTIKAYDRQLLHSADIVFCASERIHESLRGERNHIHYLPHAVDYQHFADNQDPEEPVFAGIPRPRIGYFGSLTDSNDIEIIETVARRRPEYQFALIGRVIGDYSSLERLPNVHFLGYVPYQDLPRYARSFDVGFMAWKMTEWIRNSNPLKTKEYLSLGLPVVSVRIAEIEKSLAEYVYFFDDADSFEAAIETALAEDCDKLRQDRQAIAKLDSWDQRATEMMDMFRRARS